MYCFASQSTLHLNFSVDFVFVFFADDALTMIDIGPIYIFDAIIVDDERERDFSGLVTEETFGMLDFDVAMLCEMGDEVVVSNAF